MPASSIIFRTVGFLLVAEPQMQLPHVPLRIEQSEASAPEGSRFVVAYSLMGNGIWDVEFFVSPGTGTNASKFIARRALRTVVGMEHIEIVDESQCPAIRYVVSSIENLPGLRADIVKEAPPRGVSLWPPISSMRTESNHYILWGRAIQPAGGYAEFSMASGSGLIAEWGDYATLQLSSCWAPH